ncbi:MAG TPA: molecular chaperone TorD family protein [Syntrophomonadaceae bacterium]|nr:molecular chaperone TorD family protein [Syntrophomonadaceae bacterium]
MEYCKEPIPPELYAFLAEAYKSELNEERSIKLLNLLEQIQTDVPQIQTALNELEGYLAQIALNTVNNLLPLGIEYMNLFRGAGHTPVFLYEAVHLSGEGLMYEAPYFEVKEFYENCGFEIEPGWIEPEDHISVECQFMNFMCKRILKQHDIGDTELETILQKQRDDFLREHFLKWVPQFSVQVICNTSNEFYKQLGILTESICQHASS